MTNTLTQLTETACAVKLPEEAKNPTIIKGHSYMKSDPRIEHSLGGVDLPPGQWTALGFSDEITEYKLMNIGLEDCPYFAKCWKHYCPSESPGKGATIYNPNVSCWTRKESLQSLLQSRGCTEGRYYLIMKEG